MLNTRKAQYSRHVVPTLKKRRAERVRRGASLVCCCFFLLICAAFVVALLRTADPATTAGASGHKNPFAHGAPRDASVEKTGGIPGEKPLPLFKRAGRVGTTCVVSSPMSTIHALRSWAGAWRASSEPGGVYMGGDQPLVQQALPQLDAADALARGYYVTPPRDSVAVDPLREACEDYVARVGMGQTAREATAADGYPKHHRVTELLRNWPPDLIHVPPRHYATLCRFDYDKEDERRAAFAFREAELPFLVVKNPEALQLTRHWSTPGFLERKLGSKRYMTERSDDNHFMYFNQGAASKDKAWFGATESKKAPEWKPPVAEVQLTYPQWLETALRSYNTTVVEPHYYFRVSPQDLAPSDMPIFSKDHTSLFMPFPRLTKGAHCRFGAAGIIAEAHYDGSRNFIAELGGPPSHPNSGRRRYVLARPDQCANAYLLQRGHPSARHSQIDWSRRVVFFRAASFAGCVEAA